MPQPNKSRGAVWDRREVKTDFANEKFKANWDAIFGKKEETCPTSDNKIEQEPSTSPQPPENSTFDSPES